MILDSSGTTLWIADGVDSLRAFCVASGTALARISTGPDSGNGCEESLPAPRGLAWLDGHLVVATEVGLSVVEIPSTMQPGLLRFVPREVNASIHTTICSSELEDAMDPWAEPCFAFAEEHVGMASHGDLLFVSDLYHARVQVRKLQLCKLTNGATGQSVVQKRVTFQYEVGSELLGGPNGLVVHRDRLFVADFGDDEAGRKSSIVVFTITGEPLQTFVVLGKSDQLLGGLCLLNGGKDLVVAVTDDRIDAKADSRKSRDTLEILSIYGGIV